MKKMKSILSGIVITAMILASGIPSFAFGPNETRSIDRFFADAKILKGSGNAFGLEKPANRLEGMVILIRLMGKEADAQALAEQPCQFTDVPDWAKGYVNYAYENNLSKGVSDTKFGVAGTMTADQFNTLMLRVLGYDDSKGDFFWDDATVKARELSILSFQLAHEYNRIGHVYTKGDLMDTAFCYLDADFKDQDQTVAKRLIEDGVISKDMAKEYGLKLEGLDTIRTSFSEDEYYSFHLDDELLTLTGAGTEKDKAWLLLEIATTNNGVEKAAKTTKRNGDGSYHFELSVKNLPKGEYYVNLYGNDEKYNTYHGITHSEIVMEITSDGASFTPTRVYGTNLRIYKGAEIEPQDKEISLETRADKAALEQVRTLAAEITKDCTTDYEKIKAVHDWVAENIYYDEGFAPGKYTNDELTSQVVLANRYGVCSGYSILCKDLLSAAGVPCKVVLGYAIGESSDAGWSELNFDILAENHAWNMAYADGRWIMFDATWDSTNSYLNGVFTKGDGVRESSFDNPVEYYSYLRVEMEQD